MIAFSLACSKPGHSNAQYPAAEGLDGVKPVSAYMRLVREKHSNLRAVLQVVEGWGRG